MKPINLYGNGHKNNSNNVKYPNNVPMYGHGSAKRFVKLINFSFFAWDLLKQYLFVNELRSEKFISFTTAYIWILAGCFTVFASFFAQAFLRQHLFVYNFRNDKNEISLYYLLNNTSLLINKIPRATQSNMLLTKGFI